MCKFKLLLSSLLLTFCIQTLFAGGIKGTITDQNAQPLTYSTIFVKETGTGAIANEDGRYKISLAPGTYSLVYQHIGFKTQIRQVEIAAGFIEINIVLQQQVLQLKTVEILGDGEDPAYTVMRKAIAKAAFHRQQIDSYHAQVYIKGAGRLKDSPFFLRKRIAKEGIDSSIAFVTESVSNIHYERPNTFREQVISVHQQGDQNSTSPNSYIFGSFYESDMDGNISPLSPKAFAYYKFKLDGYFVDRGYGVNKIRVIPRSRGENVFEGHIYIVEDLWNIYSLSLITHEFGFSFLIKQIYAPIEDKAWLPLSHKFDIEGKILGFALEYKYLATISDYDITLNPDLDVDFGLIDEKLDKELAAELQKQKDDNAWDEIDGINRKLAEGGELTRKDLRQLIREYEKQERKQQKEPEVVSHRDFSVDSLANKRDSAYWEVIRPVPLTPHEIKGYQWYDSLAIKEARKEARDSLKRAGKNKKGKLNPFFLISGRTYKLGEHKSLSHASFLDKFQFNPVEGYNIRTDITYAVKNKNAFSFRVTPRYAFARNKFTGKIRIQYEYGPRLKKNALTLEGGRYIYQYNSQNPISELLNTFTNLLNKKNYIRLYEKDYANVNYALRPHEKLQFTMATELANRFTLSNNSSHSWFKHDDRAYAPNTPLNEEVEDPFPITEKAFFVAFGIEAKPWQKYRVRNKKKTAIENSSPAFSLNYRKGISGPGGSRLNYDLLDFTYRHHFHAGARGKIDLKVNAGIFLNNGYVGFADFKHFMGNRTTFTTSDPVGSFRLLDYYKHSTQEEYLSAHVHYQFRKLLFTQIPELWLLGLKENVFLNYLATPTSENYFEIGYSLDNIFKFLRLETAFAFQNGKYKDFGILIGIASNLGGGGISFN